MDAPETALARSRMVAWLAAGQYWPQSCEHTLGWCSLRAFFDTYADTSLGVDREHRLAWTAFLGSNKWCILPGIPCAWHSGLGDIVQLFGILHLLLERTCGTM